MIYQFKIQIKDITKPPVWRRILVPTDFTFLQFHDTIQTAFGWFNCHLFEFTDNLYEGSVRIIIPSKEDWDLFFGEPLDASQSRLSDVFTEAVQKYFYIYDFGDNWVHVITLEKVLEEDIKEPVCLAGKGACPPEDCRGVWGYEEMKAVFRERPNSKAASEYRSWLGMEKREIWDACEFNIDEVNRKLKLRID